MLIKSVIILIFLSKIRTEKYSYVCVTNSSIGSWNNATNEGTSPVYVGAHKKLKDFTISPVDGKNTDLEPISVNNINYITDARWEDFSVYGNNTKICEHGKFDLPINLGFSVRLLKASTKLEIKNGNTTIITITFRKEKYGDATFLVANQNVTKRIPNSNSWIHFILNITYNAIFHIHMPVQNITLKDLEFAGSAGKITINNYPQENLWKIHKINPVQVTTNRSRIYEFKFSRDNITSYAFECLSIYYYLKNCLADLMLENNNINKTINLNEEENWKLVKICSTNYLTQNSKLYLNITTKFANLSKCESYFDELQLTLSTDSQTRYIQKSSSEKLKGVCESVLPENKSCANILKLNTFEKYCQDTNCEICCKDNCISYGTSPYYYYSSTYIEYIAYILIPIMLVILSVVICMCIRRKRNTINSSALIENDLYGWH